MNRLEAKIADTFVGESFTDTYGNVVERAGDTDLFVGPGYNGDVPVRMYLDARKYGEFYGRYPLTAAEAQDLRAYKMCVLPDFRWAAGLTKPKNVVQ